VVPDARRGAVTGWCIRRWNKTAHVLTIPPMKSAADDLPILYTKKGCPWCEEAVAFLDGHGVGYRLKEVTNDREAMAEMQRKSGQTRAPTLDWRGKVLADFGTDELVPFLRAQNVRLEDS
jgi:glutaredoxin